MAGLDAHGTTLSRGDGADPEVFSPVANLTSIDGPEIERNMLDVTDHDSEGWAEKLGAIKDAGEISIEGHMHPGKHFSLQADFDDAAARNWQIAWPDGSNVEFTAFLQQFSTAAPHDDKRTFSGQLAVTGKPTWNEPE